MDFRDPLVSLALDPAHQLKGQTALLHLDSLCVVNVVNVLRCVYPM